MKNSKCILGAIGMLKVNILEKGKNYKQCAYCLCDLLGMEHFFIIFIFNELIWTICSSADQKKTNEHLSALQMWSQNKKLSILFPFPQKTKNSLVFTI